MQKLLFMTVLLTLLGTVSVSAFTVDVESSSTEKIVLSFSGFTEFPVIEDVTAQAETGTLTDRYLADTKLSVSGDKILLEVDVSEIFEDYSASDIKSITVAGVADGEEFAKRVAYRETSAPRQLAPEDGSGTSPLRWALGLVLLIIFLVLFYLVLTKKPVKRQLPAMAAKTKKKSSRKKGKKSKAKKKR